MKSRKFLIYFSLLFLVAADSSRADVIIQIGAGGKGSGNGNLPYFHSETSLAPGAVSGNGSGDGNGRTVVGSSANQPSSWLSGAIANFSTSAFSDRANPFVPQAIGSAGAIYGDEVYLTGAGALPASIRLHFHASGTLTPYQVGAGSVHATSQVNFLALGSSFQGSFSDPDTIGIQAATEAVNPTFGNELAKLEYIRDWDDITIPLQSTKQSQSGWANLSAATTGGTFDGSFHQDITFDSAINGYDFESLFAVHSVAGLSSADASASVRLFAVTDSSGSPLSGFEVSFASGRTLSAVPEPSSASLLLSLAALSIGTRRRR